MTPSSSANEVPPKQWYRFLAELDALLQKPVELHCIGGFVIAACYGFPRPTGDLDYISVRPSGAAVELHQVAGEGSELHKKHKLYLQHVGVANYPENYADRLIALYPGLFQNLRLFALDPYDLALSKLERNIEVDRDDVKFLSKTVPLDFQILEQRYRDELRPYLANPDKHDLTVKLWREAYFPPGPTQKTG